ncbi:Hypothetical protein A7982_02284 [Minicystis rosea]|nr:Hypothetical protein A7982_02284 [Minicystis rosea]
MRRPMTTPRLPSPRRAALLLGLCLAAPLAGCKGKGGSALAKAEAKDNPFANVPAPAVDNPRLHPTLADTPVYDRPSPEGKKIGELRIGSSVARSREPYGTEECKGGWYAVRPRGFVCVGPGASLDPGMEARGIPARPDLAKPLPYRYARARTENVPLYARAPSAAEMAASEPDLRKILGRAEDKDALGAAANDVPLDPRGVPTGPAVLLPGGEGIADGKRSASAFFQFGMDALPPAFAPAADSVKIGGLKKGSGVAVAGSLGVDAGTAARRFGVTADGRLVPIDRMKPILGSTWHGIDLDKVGLPVAFVHKLGVHGYSLAKGKATEHEDEVERRAAIPLSGKFRTVEGVRYEETRDGTWMRSKDIVVVVKRHKFPDFAKGGQKWLDVSVATQTLTAYEGTKPIYATLITTGRDQLKDPATSASTARGTFKVLAKHVTRTLDPREVQGAFDVADAPWVMEFEPGHALTGMYWGEGVGEASTFHAVGLTPIDARRLWTWSDPQLPEGWHAVYGGGDDSTIVFVRP